MTSHCFRRQICPESKRPPTKGEHTKFGKGAWRSYQGLYELLAGWWQQGTGLGFAMAQGPGSGCRLLEGPAYREHRQLSSTACLLH